MTDTNNNLSSTARVEIENAKKCDDLRCDTSVVGLKLKDSILLVAKLPQNYALELTQHRIIRNVSENILISACGYGIDGHHVVRKAQTEAVSISLSTELPCQTREIVSKLSEYLQMFATKPEYRPLGVSAIVAGQNINKTMSLIKITAGGEKYEYNACCIGRNATELNAELEKCYDMCLCSASGLKCVMRLLRESAPKNLQVGIIRDGQAKVLNESEVNALLRHKPWDFSKYLCYFLSVKQSFQKKCYPCGVPAIPDMFV